MGLGRWVRSASGSSRATASRTEAIYFSRPSCVHACPASLPWCDSPPGGFID
ncbi:hypothetical protein D187_004042 [Cystobacter fuscus DSM 2262]|uniref:Uncharacterized protein n=1 Tax=Cystobacter fuscus (strain ATCC 25194 / DSM 2262 / NBRC 100088 / M29) TaxID=1242864 RepID=S9P513_CYSF2|nr:hypothetical protein D187_004042 [Cystobacter fuscus DSM 2262]